MNREQKRALALVVSMSLAAILGAAALAVHLLDLGSPMPLILFAGAVQGTGVLVCLRVRPDKDAVASDERSKLIEKNAHLAGFGAVYFFVIVASFAPIAIFGENGSLPATWCPALLIGAGFCQAYAQSVAILVQYGWSGKGEQR